MGGTKKKNKVKYGLENVHYAMVEELAGGGIGYGTPKKIPGAVSLSLSPQGDPAEFYADNMQYFVQYVNDGYEGDMVIALIPDEFKQDALGETETNGLVVENAETVQKPFALLFEFSGDETRTRHVIYYCTASRPNIASATKTKGLEVQPETLSIKAGQRPDTKDIKARTNENTPEEVYDGWFVNVPDPTNITVPPETGG